MSFSHLGTVGADTVSSCSGWPSFSDLSALQLLRQQNALDGASSGTRADLRELEEEATSVSRSVNWFQSVLHAAPFVPAGRVQGSQHIVENTVARRNLSATSSSSQGQYKNEYGELKQLCCLIRARANLDNVDINRKFKTGDTEKCALHYAVGKDDLSAVRSLVQLRADIDAKDHNHDTPLSLATMTDFPTRAHIEIVQLLLENEANPDTVTKFFGTPLVRSAHRGHVAIVDLLCRSRADVNASASTRWAPLHAASRHGHQEIVALLLERRANVNLQEVERSFRPLDYAVRYSIGTVSNREVVRHLVDSRANLLLHDEVNRFVQTRRDGTELKRHLEEIVRVISRHQGS